MDYYKYKGFEKRLNFETIDDISRIKPSRKTNPANRSNKPTGTPKVVPFPSSKSVNIETRQPRDFKPKIPFSKVFGNPLLNFLLQPNMTAGPYEDEYDWRNYESDVSKQIAENNFVGQDLAVRKQDLKVYDLEYPTKPVKNANFIRPPVPILPWNERDENTPHISVSPKIGTIEYVVPRYHVPPPIPIELPEVHPLFDEPVPQEVPDLVKQFDEEVRPYTDTDTMRVRKPDQLKERGVAIEIKAGNLPKVRIRPMTVRAATKRKNDTKAASRWIKLSQMAISLTYGTYTEIQDFVDIIIWDTYYIDPRTGRLVYAMFKEEYDIVKVLNGIASGKYHVDIAATLVDFGVSQAQDILIGQASRQVTRQTIDTGNWRSPQGPQGFINKMQKDFRNVLSQYEKNKNSNEKSRGLSLQPLSESPRRLWNAKSGLSSKLWS